MLIMCHLFIGLVIGLVAFRYSKDQRVILLAGIGSILPDLIDKPLGHIVLNGSVDFGRIYAHSGLFLICILVVAIAYWRKKGSWIFFALAAGVASHLVLDSMWELPVTLFYPVLGDFGMHYFPNYFEDSIIKELGSAYEWIFGVSALATLIYTYRDRLGEYQQTVSKMIPRIMKYVSLLLIFVGLLSIFYASMSLYNPLSQLTDLEQNLIIGLSATVGGIITRIIWSDSLSDSTLTLKNQTKIKD